MLKKFNWKLFVPLLLLAFMPNIYNFFKIFLLFSNENPEAISIAGHIEWFDLLDETIRTALVLPLYFIFNKIIKEKKRNIYNEWHTIFYSLVSLYIIFIAIVLAFLPKMMKSMKVNDAIFAETYQYLMLEGITFIIAFTVAILMTWLTIKEKTKLFYILFLVQLIVQLFADYFWISKTGVIGVALSKLFVQSLLFVIILGSLHQDKMFRKFKIDFSWIKDILPVSIYAALSIILSNFVYFTIIMKMINELEVQGLYWVVNEFIWNLLLIPFATLAIIIKKESNTSIVDINIKPYFAVTGLLLGLTSLTFAFWNMFFVKMLKVPVSDMSVINEILYSLLPFYLCYILSLIFDSVLIGLGKTSLILINDIVVNVVYYSLMYWYYLNYIETVTIEFIVNLFGYGMVVHLIMSIILYFLFLRSESSRQKNIKTV